MLGIPARYVEGYNNSQSTPNNVATIYSTDAHSWFEFFDPQFGWIMGDATPGNTLAASHFNIDAVAEIYPETEYDVFSVNPLNVSREELPLTDPSEEVSSPSDTSATTPNSTPGEDYEGTSETTTTEATAASGEITSTSQEDVSATDTSSLTGPNTASEKAKDDTDKINIGEYIQSLLRKTTHSLAPLFTVIGLILALRLGYIVFWKNRFSQKNKKNQLQNI